MTYVAYTCLRRDGSWGFGGATLSAPIASPDAIEAARHAIAESLDCAADSVVLLSWQPLDRT